MFQAQILTLFPEFFDSPLACSIPARAIRAGIIQIDYLNIRDFTTDKHRSVDDSPYGGGPGMVMKPEPTVATIREARKRHPETHVIMLSPSGALFSQEKARSYASMPGLTLLCGRYEGFDERIADYVDERLSLGNYVLSGGEPAATCVLDAIIRLLPGALGDAESAKQDSFSTADELDWPQYTRPELFEGKQVPEVLLSGDHARTATWRQQQAKLRSRRHRRTSQAPNKGLT